MAELSPAAQAIVQPFNDDWDEYCLAAALEALALQDETLFDVEDELVPAIRAVRTDRILAIAAELRGGAA